MRIGKLLGKMAKSNVLDGVFAINKPLGHSSAQVIRDCQVHFNTSELFAPLIHQQQSARAEESNRQFQRRRHAKKDLRVKMGHGGTLDPLATGVLILGVGSGTKSLQSFLECTKTYETVVLFGASTDTYDRVGRVLMRRPYDHIKKETVEKALDDFRGKIKQTPPLYSALKMEGKPLYEYAREGKQIPREIPVREVEVQELELLEWYEPGSHKWRWPSEEAEVAECQLAEKVWKLEKSQSQGSTKKLTPEEETAEAAAIAEHEAQKRKFDEDVDGLVRDRPSKKRKRQMAPPAKRDGSLALMSGALGQMPQSPNGKGSNLIPPDPDESTPPPWADDGPPAARIRLTVTSGFYVRSFCHDLGLKVNSAANMAELCRSRQGDFSVGGPTCLEYSDLAKGESVWAPKVSSMLELWAKGARARAGRGSPKTTKAQPVQTKNSGTKSPKNGSPPRPSVETELVVDEVPKTEHPVEETTGAEESDKNIPIAPDHNMTEKT